MDLALDNLQSGGGVIIDILERIEKSNPIDPVSLCVLLNSNMVSPQTKENTLSIIAEHDVNYHRLWIEFVKRELFPLHNSKLLASFKNYLISMIKVAYLHTEDETISVYRDITYSIACGYSEFYPYIWHLFSRRGKASSAHSEEYRAMSYYSVVFGFDGYNDKYIKEKLKRSPSYTEGEFEVFSKVKTPTEKAYSKFGRAILSVMQDAFKHRKFNEDKFVEQLMAIPHEYKDRLHVSTLLNNGERLYCSFRRFFKEGGAYKIYNLPFKSDENTTEGDDTKQ